MRLAYFICGMAAVGRTHAAEGIRSAGEMDEFRKEGAKGAAAMAERMFLLKGNFRHGESQLRKPEDRIVAETAVTAGHAEDFAVDGAFSGQKQLTVARYGQGATIAGSTLRDAPQPREQVEIVAFIVGESGSSAARLVTGILSKARRAHTGFAAQGVYFEAGIVSKDEARSEAAVVLRFHPGVARKGGFVLGGRGDLPESGRRFNGESTFGSGDGEVAQLAGVGGGCAEGEHSSVYAGIFVPGWGRAFFRSH